MSDTRRLKRLLGIRHITEEMHQRELEVATGAVVQVETALSLQEAALSAAARAVRVALSEGRREDSLMAEAQSEVARWNLAQLRILLTARQAEVVPARAQFIESRREHEQIRRLVQAAQQIAAVDEDRRSQAAADDWFLGRRVRLAQPRL